MRIESQHKKTWHSARDAWDILWDCIHRFGDHDCMQLSAGIAYYSLLSLFPLAMLLVSISAYFFDPQEASSWLVERLGQSLPVSRDFLRDGLRGVVDNRGTVGLVGLVGLAIGSTAAFGAVIRSINRAWGFSGRIPRSFIKSKFWEFTLLAAVAILFLLALAFTGFMEAMRQSHGGFALRFIPFGFMFCVFLLLYKFMPATKVRWRDIWLPSLLAAATFEVAKQAFTWYVSTLGHYSALYGSLASVVILLLWVYFSAALLLFGAELCSVIATRRGSYAVDT